jgi:hypothetical protein
MSTCAQFVDMAIAAAWGDLAAELQPALHAHLAACAACRARLAAERRLSAQLDVGLARIVAAEPSPGFAARVLAQVTGDAERKLLAAIDAGLAGSVAGEPSPEFAAALRARIAAEAPPRHAWFSLGPALGAVAAALLLLFLWKGETLRPQPVGRTTTTENAATPGPLPPLLIPVKEKRTRPRTMAPEVLVPEEERRAVTRFYRFVQEGRIHPEQVLLANRIELALRLKELETPLLVAASRPLKPLDLVDSPRSTSVASSDH